MEDKSEFRLNILIDEINILFLTNFDQNLGFVSGSNPIRLNLTNLEILSNHNPMMIHKKVGCWFNSLWKTTLELD